MAYISCESPEMSMKRKDLIDSLLRSSEPSIRWKMLVHVLGESPNSKLVKDTQIEIKHSPRVRSLLSRRDAQGHIRSGNNAYDKWQGAHWVLSTLADLGYPPGDSQLLPIRDQVLDLWLHDHFFQEFEARTKTDAYKKDGVPIMNGRHRRCASQQGNALRFITMLGIADARAERLVERLMHWQWPDGGWNCDKDPDADSSSFMETLFPMLGLALHGRQHQLPEVEKAARRAAEVFLCRKLFRRRSDGAVIHPEFTQFHYPLYWHYDVLGGLKAMTAMGLIKDQRCAEALDLLQTKELAQGGWAAEKRYYKVSEKLELNADYVDWGGTSKSKRNDWITADALTVLTAAGRV